MLAFIDEIVIPFLNGLYGAVGYLGVLVAMAIESAMIPLPSELILPYAGFLVSDPTQIEPLTGGPWNFWIVVVVATIGNTLGSLVAYAIGAYGGRPFLERYGKYLLIRPHEIELGRVVLRAHGAATVFIGRLLPIVRTFISFPAGVARMPHRQVHRLLDGRRLPVVDRCWSTRARSSARTGWTSATRSSRSTWRSRSPSSLLIVGFIWWRLGMPGEPGRRRPGARGVRAD